MDLDNYCEIVGILNGVRKKNNKLVLSFEMSKEIIIYPEEKLENNLRDFIGHRVGIFNLNGKYHIREVKDANKIEKS